MPTLAELSLKGGSQTGGANLARHSALDPGANKFIVVCLAHKICKIIQSLQDDFAVVVVVAAAV